MKTTNLPAGFELLSDEETFLNELVDEQDFLVAAESGDVYQKTRIEISETTLAISQQYPQLKSSVFAWNSKPKFWTQRTVNIKTFM
jgi:hypothetical protein